MDSPGRRRSSARKTIVTGLIAAAVLALGIAASIRVQRDALAKHDPATGIAVLPFATIGRSEGQVVADGMTAEITNRLASLHSLRVVGRGSARDYRNSGKTPQQIARELGVKYLVTGTVRWDKSADGKILVRVSPALLQGEDASPMWAEAYQSMLGGVLDVQSKVAAEVVHALNLSLLAPERIALRRKPTDDLAAYALYARARQIVDDSFQVAAMREAVGLLQRATKRDPEFTAAWALLAIAYTELYWNSTDKSSELLALARSALGKAAAIDSDDPDVHLARGIYLYHGERNYVRAMAELDAVERARPSDPGASLYKGAINRHQRRLEEAVRDFKRAVALDPRNGRDMLEVANTLYRLERYGEAEIYVDRGMALAPREPLGPILKSRLAIDARGNVPEAVEHLRNAAHNVQPASSMIVVLQSETWPAVEDSGLRQLLTDAHPTIDASTGSIHAAKASLFRYLGDLTRARVYADSAALAINAQLQRTGETQDLYDRLAFVAAIMGRQAEASRAMSRADALLPESVDAWTAMDRANARPRLFAILGDSDAAIDALEKRVAQPGGISANRVRLDPVYASLRADARFQALIRR